MANVAQWLEYQIVDLGVAGSNPVIRPLFQALVAQWIEHRTSDPQVAGSTPIGRVADGIYLMRARGSMDRAVDSGSKGCRFDSYRAHRKRYLKTIYTSGPLAQLVEHRIFNPGATGSNPVRLIFKSQDKLHKHVWCGRVMELADMQDLGSCGRP